MLGSEAGPPGVSRETSLRHRSSVDPAAQQPTACRCGSLPRGQKDLASSRPDPQVGSSDCELRRRNGRGDRQGEMANGRAETLAKPTGPRDPSDVPRETVEVVKAPYPSSPTRPKPAGRAPRMHDVGARDPWPLTSRPSTPHGLGNPGFHSTPPVPATRHPEVLSGPRGPPYCNPSRPSQSPALEVERPSSRWSRPTPPATLAGPSVTNLSELPLWQGSVEPTRLRPSLRRATPPYPEPPIRDRSTTGTRAGNQAPPPSPNVPRETPNTPPTGQPNPGPFPSPTSPTRSQPLTPAPSPYTPRPTTPRPPNPT